MAIGVCVCVGGGGCLNLRHPSVLPTAVSKKREGNRPGKGHDDPGRCFNKYGALKDEDMEVEAPRNHSSS